MKNCGQLLFARAIADWEQRPKFRRSRDFLIRDLRSNNCGRSRCFDTQPNCSRYVSSKTLIMTVSESGLSPTIVSRKPIEERALFRTDGLDFRRFFRNR